MSVYRINDPLEPKELTQMELWGEEDIKPLTEKERKKLEEEGQMRFKWDS